MVIVGKILIWRWITMKTLKVDHIGIAVPNIEEALKLYRDVLGIELAGIEVVEEQKVKVAFLPLGDTEIELLESTDPEGTIAKFIEKNGGRAGLHHIALRVDNIEEAIKELKEKGIRLIYEEPRYGAGKAKITFLHPKATGGVLLELSEREE